jgi:hypothetical protein
MPESAVHMLIFGFNIRAGFTFILQRLKELSSRVSAAAATTTTTTKQQQKTKNNKQQNNKNNRTKITKIK